MQRHFHVFIQKILSVLIGSVPSSPVFLEPIPLKLVFAPLL